VRVVTATIQFTAESGTEVRVRQDDEDYPIGAPKSHRTNRLKQLGPGESTACKYVTGASTRAGREDLCGGRGHRDRAGNRSERMTTDPSRRWRPPVARVISSRRQVDWRPHRVAGCRRVVARTEARGPGVFRLTAAPASETPRSVAIGTSPPSACRCGSCTHARSLRVARGDVSARRRASTCSARDHRRRDHSLVAT
jgi:hypothetical protein